MLKITRKSQRIAFLLIPVTAALFAFQNCGPAVSTSADFASSLAPSTNGGKFNQALLPVSAQGRLKTDLDSYGYMPDFRALAFAANGYGIATGSSKFASQTEASLLIQQQCQLLAGNLPCVVFAEGMTAKYSKEDYMTHFNSVVDAGTRDFDGTRVPTMLSSNRYYGFGSTNYTSGDDAFKAFAIGNYGRAAHGSGASQIEADQRALETCEGIDGTPCLLYAEGDTVVFNTTVFNWNNVYPNIIYGPRTFNANNIPFVKNADKTSIANRVSAVPANRHWALAIGRYGENYFVTDATSSAATLQALAVIRCNDLIAFGADYTCMLHSVDGQTVLKPDDIKAHNSTSSTWN